MSELKNLLGREDISNALVENGIETLDQFLTMALSDEREKLRQLMGVSDEELDRFISVCQKHMEHTTIPTGDGSSGEKLLTDIDEFLSFGTILDNQGISTVIDFLSLAKNNPDGLKELLSIDEETMDRLIVYAKNELSDKELKRLEESKIKEVGKDYKLGLLLEEE